MAPPSTYIIRPNLSRNRKPKATRQLRKRSRKRCPSSRNATTKSQRSSTPRSACWPRRKKDQRVGATQELAAVHVNIVRGAAKSRAVENVRQAAREGSDPPAVASPAQDLGAAATNAESARQVAAESKTTRNFTVFLYLTWKNISDPAVAARIEDIAVAKDLAPVTSAPAAIAQGNCEASTIFVTFKRKQTKVQFSLFALEAVSTAQNPANVHDHVTEASARKSLTAARRRKNASIHSRVHVPRVRWESQRRARSHRSVVRRRRSWKRFPKSVCATTMQRRRLEWTITDVRSRARKVTTTWTSRHELELWFFFSIFNRIFFSCVNLKILNKISFLWVFNEDFYWKHSYLFAATVFDWWASRQLAAFHRKFLQHRKGKSWNFRMLLDFVAFWWDLERSLGDNWVNILEKHEYLKLM